MIFLEFAHRLFAIGFMTLAAYWAPTPFSLSRADWTPTTPLPQALASHRAVVRDDFIYIVGGKNAEDRPVGDVYLAQIEVDGGLSNWQTVGQLPVPVYIHAVVATTTHLYVIGGWDGSRTRAEIWRAPFTAEHTLGSFQQFGIYPYALDLHAAVIVQNRLYIFGGWTGKEALNTVYYAELQNDGLGPWRTSRSLPARLYRLTVVAHQDIIYLIGGYDSTATQATVYATVYTTHVQSNGTLTPWQPVTPLPMAVSYHEALVHNDQLWVLGGRGDATEFASSYSAPIAADGTLGAWSPALPLPESRYRLAAVAVKHHGRDDLYVLGGLHDDETQAGVYQGSIFPITVTTTTTLTSLPGGAGRIDLIWVIPNTTTTRLVVGVSAGNGMYQVLPGQALQGLEGPGYETLTGDVNGDGWTDLIGNQKSAEGNRFVVALGNGNGTFRQAPVQAQVGRLWQHFKTLVGDVNGDGNDDLIWNETSAVHNRIYVGLSNGDGTFALGNFQDHGASSWQNFKTLVGDVNGDRWADLIWNETVAAHNRLYVGLSNGDGTFRFLDFQDHRGRVWQGFKTLLGDVNGDGNIDLIWNETSATHNRTYVGLAHGDGTFELLPYQDRAEPQWSPYQTFVGDVNGDALDDLIWNMTNAEQNRISVGFALGDGTFTFGGFQDQLAPGWQGYQTFVGDVDGDGRTDLLWNDKGADKNRLSVGLSKGDGAFLLLPPQDMGDSDWTQYQTLLGYAD